MIGDANRCVYCQSKGPFSVEHMPPKGMFDRNRPPGWCFAACQECHNGTSAADAVAQLVSFINPDPNEDWQLKALSNRRDSLKRIAPTVYDELMKLEPSSQIFQWKGGLVLPATEVTLIGEATRKHLNCFSAKVAMAGFSQLVDRPIDENGVIFTKWFCNGGMQQETYDALVNMLPMRSELTQGKLTSGKKFFVRHNTDNKNIVAALYSFQATFHVFAIACDGEELTQPTRDILADMVGTNYPTSQVITPALPSLQEYDAVC